MTDVGDERKALVEELIKRAARTPPLSFIEAKQLLDENNWNVDDASQAMGLRRRPRSCWDNWVFGMAVRWLKQAHLFATSFMPSPMARPPSLLDQHHSFLLAYEAQFGAFHPTFVEGSLFDALVKGKRQCKFVLVYLHSWQHGDTEAFCSQTLASEAVVQFCDTNFVMWAADVSSRAGFEAAASLGVSSYPFIGMLYSMGEGARGTEVRRLGALLGPLSVDELLAQLLGLMEEHDALLVADRADVEQREMNRRLLAEQDADYEASLRADQAREQALEQQSTQEEEGKQKEEEEEEEEEVRVVGEIPDEPAPEEEGVVEVAVRLPHARLQRRFRVSDPLTSLFAWCDAHVPSSQRYVLVSAYPRAVYRSSPQTLLAAGFQNKMALLYEEDDE